MAGSADRRSWLNILLFLLMAGMPSVGALPAKESTGFQDEVVAVITGHLCNAQVVGLGELPTHGEAQAHVLKARIARQLVEQCGFTLLLFEAPLYEFTSIDQAEDPAIALDAAIGGFWTSIELTDFRNWLSREYARGALQLGGIDDQIAASSVHSRSVLPRLIADASGMPECAEAVRRNLFWHYGSQFPYDAGERYLLHSCASLSARTGHLSGRESLFVQNLSRLYARQAGLIPAFPGRGDSLALNAQHHIKAHGDPKTIIWAANTHVARYGRQGLTLGSRFAQVYGTGYAALGITALTGSSARAGGRAAELAELPTASLEHRALAAISPGFTAPAVLAADDLLAFDYSVSRLVSGNESQPWSTLFDVVVVLERVSPPRFVVGTGQTDD